ncbi:MAG: glycosyltransferase family 4 protein, partial [Chloroflexi bacterium]|nr:glycosyltransferase family 4 protein [Chloroflexota bacterium]
RALARRLRRLQKRLGVLEVRLAGQGSPDQETAWRAALASEGLAESTQWLGWVPTSGLAAAAAGAWAALVPLSDDLVNRARFPVKALELMALGLPLAADPVGELPYLLDGGACGLLVPGQEEAWVAAVAGFLGRMEQRQALGQRARARVRQCFCWADGAEALEALYGGLLP